MMLKKKVLIISMKQGQSEQTFGITNAKRVAVFHVSLKLVREKAASQLSNKDNKEL